MAVALLVNVYAHLCMYIIFLWTHLVKDKPV